MPADWVPESWSNMFQDSDFTPPLMWKVKVSALCPKCAQEMILGSIVDGSALVKCLNDKCQHSETYKGTTSDALAKSVLEKMAKNMKE